MKTFLSFFFILFCFTAGAQTIVGNSANIYNRLTLNGKVVNGVSNDIDMPRDSFKIATDWLVKRSFDTIYTQKFTFGNTPPASIGFDAGVQLYGSSAGSSSIYQYRVGAAPSIVMGRANGTLANPTLVTSGQEFGRLKIGSTDGITFYDYAMMSSYVPVGQNWSATNRPYETRFYTVPNGSTVGVTRIILGNDGMLQFNAYQKTPTIRTQNYQSLGVDPLGNVVRTDMSEFGVNVKSFGAVGDGVTDDYNAVNSAYLFLKSIGGGTLRFPGPAVYKVNTTIAVDTSNIHVQIDPSATVLRGSLGGVSLSDGYAAVFTFMGSESLAVTTATAPITSGNNTINVASTDSLKVGDYIRVYSNQNFSYARTYYTNSYITKILSVAGTTLTIQPMSISFDTLSPKMYASDIWQAKTYEIVDRVKSGESDITDYTTLGAANNNTGTRFISSIDSDTLVGSGTVRQVSTIYISKLRPLKNVGVYGGGRINGNNYANGQTGSVVGVYMKNTVNAYIRNIGIDSVKGYAAYVRNSLNPEFTDNKVMSATDSSTNDFGVYFDQCVNYSAVGNRIKTGFSGIDASSSFIGYIVNNKLEKSNIDPHSGKFINILNNTINNAGITIRVDNSKIIGNTINWNQKVADVDQGIILTEGATNGNLDITGNTVNFTYPISLYNIVIGIYSQTGNIARNKRCHRYFSNWNISNNTINGATRGMDVSIGSAFLQNGILPSKITIKGNTIRGYRQYGVLSSSLSNSEITDNKIYLDSAFANSIQQSIIDSSYLTGITPAVSSQGRIAITNTDNKAWFLPSSSNATTYSNWLLQPNIPSGISMVGLSSKKNNNIQLTTNTLEGAGIRTFYLTNIDTASLVNNRIINNSSGSFNGTTYTKSQTWADPYQPVENQRLSTTNNVQFNTIKALNNGGIGFSGQNYAGYSFGTNGYAATDTKINTYPGTNILFQVNSVTAGSLDSTGSMKTSSYDMSTTSIPSPASGHAIVWFDGTNVKVTKNVGGTTTTTTLF